MFNIYGKIAVITNAGCSMGESHALTLASQGAIVILTDKRKGGCNKVATEITGRGGEGYCYQMDRSEHSQIHAVFAAISLRFGGIDILVNSAETYRPTHAVEVAEKEWDQLIYAGLTAQLICAQRAAEEMAKRHWGRIINISSSIPAALGIHFTHAHAAITKDGMIKMTEELANTWAENNISVNAIVLGFMKEPGIEGARMSKKVEAAILAHIPLKRMGKPADVSAAVAFLASEDASYITGATLCVNGGLIFD